MAIGPIEILKFPHPALKHPSKPLKKVDADLARTIRSMFDLMYQSNGVGLAANQVGLPFRFFIVNERADPEEGEELIFINPVISNRSGAKEGEEGCLSFPGLYANVSRAEKIKVTAFNLQGQSFEMRASGMMARIIQHESDHLDGVVFPERVDEFDVADIRPGIAVQEDEFLFQQSEGAIPSTDDIEKRLAELELQYC